ncbi:MAG: hypothetical protein ACT4O1_12630 [Gemmatimonadota bacterium]
MRRYIWLLLAIFVPLYACQDSPADLQPTDTTPPRIAIEISSADGDSDGDGFVDIRNPWAFDAHFNLACDRNDDTIYVTDPFTFFDMKTRTWQGDVEATVLSSLSIG